MKIYDGRRSSLGQLGIAWTSRGYSVIYAKPNAKNSWSYLLTPEGIRGGAGLMAYETLDVLRTFITGIGVRTCDGGEQ
jgi:hypothetical protein